MESSGQFVAEKWLADKPRTVVGDDGSEFDPLAGKRLDIKEPCELLEGDWVESRESSVQRVNLSARANEAEVHLVDGQSFTFYDDKHIVVYRRSPASR